MNSDYNDLVVDADVRNHREANLKKDGRSSQ
jgi:hypothetical protein